MEDGQELRNSIQRLLSGDARDLDRRLVRSAITTGEIAFAPSRHDVTVGGNVVQSVILSGNVTINVAISDSQFVQRILSAVPAGRSRDDPKREAETREQILRHAQGGRAPGNIRKSHPRQQADVAAQAAPHEEQFCQELPGCEQVGKWKFTSLTSTWSGGGMYRYLLSQHDYGRRPYVIRSVLRFFDYNKFSRDGLNTANAGVIFGWRSTPAGRSYHHLLFTGRDLTVENVGDNDYLDFVHIGPAVDFQIVEGRWYQFTILVNRSVTDVFMDGARIYSLFLSTQIGRVGIRPWRAQVECASFSAREL